MWSLRLHERRVGVVYEMVCLRNISGIRRKDRVRNSQIKERCACEVRVIEKVKGDVLKWFEHVERIREGQRVKNV